MIALAPLYAKQQISDLKQKLNTVEAKWAQIEASKGDIGPIMEEFEALWEPYSKLSFFSSNTKLVDLILEWDERTMAANPRYTGGSWIVYLKSFFV
jgi:hypothetical protein